MKLYLLQVTGEIDYDSYDAKVVIANCESEARKMANIRTYDEGAIWEDKTRVKCENIRLGVKNAGVLLGSFNAG